jgi:hypothetical protein
MYSFMQIEKYEPQFVEINHARTQNLGLCIHKKDQILVKIEALAQTIFVLSSCKQEIICLWN